MRRRFPDADVVVFGHSHIPMKVEAGAQLLFNPGSPTWKRRQPRPTFGILEVSGGVVAARIVQLEDGPGGRIVP
jgi:putative phosphoesterase